MPIKKKNKSLYGGVSSSQFLHQSPLLLNLLSQVSLGRGDEDILPPRMIGEDKPIKKLDVYVPPPRRKLAVSENMANVLIGALTSQVAAKAAKIAKDTGQSLPIDLPPLPIPEPIRRQSPLPIQIPSPLPPLPPVQPLEPVVHQSMPQLTSPPVYMGSMQPSNQHIFNEYEIGPRRYELEKWKVLHRDEVQKEKLLKKKEALDLKQEKQKGDLKLKELGKRSKVLRTKLTKLKKMYK